jgi:hypothetical protein
MFSDDEPKRTKPTKALKKMVYLRDKGVCCVCNEKVDPFNFEIGHNVAHSKGGKLTLQNAILICSLCNKSMRTLTLKQMRKQLGLPEPETHQDKAKKALTKLTTKQLKFLARDSEVKIKGKVSEGLFSSTTFAPSKRQYVIALSKKITEEQVKEKLAQMPVSEPKRKKRAKDRNNFSIF